MKTSYKYYIYKEIKNTDSRLCIIYKSYLQNLSKSTSISCTFIFYLCIHFYKVNVKSVKVANKNNILHLMIINNLDIQNNTSHLYGTYIHNLLNKYLNDFKPNYILSLIHIQMCIRDRPGSSLLPRSAYKTKHKLKYQTFCYTIVIFEHHVVQFEYDTEETREENTASKGISGKNKSKQIKITKTYNDTSSVLNGQTKGIRMEKDKKKWTKFVYL